MLDYLNGILYKVSWYFLGAELKNIYMTVVGFLRIFHYFILKQKDLGAIYNGQRNTKRNGGQSVTWWKCILYKNVASPKCASPKLSVVGCCYG